MSDLILGRLIPVDIRSIWRHEALEFTPWLAKPENISLLAETLHLGELTVTATEKDVGDFSADIVAEDEGGAHVLIENQLEQTDHRHLGQVLTYLAGLDGEATVVWIAARFREEHRAALDWLNANTNERFDFFGVEVEVLQIGTSHAAPRFSVIAKPNNWSRAVGKAARRAADGANGEGKLANQTYWSALGQAYEAAGETGYFRNIWDKNWLPFKIGRSGFGLYPNLLRKDRTIRFELYMHQKNCTPPKHAFHQLLAQREAIEHEFGAPLDWQELPDSVASRVAVYLRDANIDDTTDWPRQHAWILQQLRSFRRVFTNRVRDIKLNGSSPESGE